MRWASDWGTVYPLSLLLSLVICGLLLLKGGWWHAIQGLLPGLLLGVGIAAMGFWRGEWMMAVAVLGATALHFLWGAAAYRFALGGYDLHKITRGFIGLLALSLVLGGLGWMLRLYWPQGCNVFNCGGTEPWPFRFTGGFEGPDLFLLALTLLLPPLAVSMVQSLEDPRDVWLKWIMGLLALLAGLGVIAGSPLWALSGVLISLALSGAVFYGAARPGGIFLFKASIFSFFLSMVVVFILNPEYVERLFFNEAQRAPLQLKITTVPPERLFSWKSTTLQVEVKNTGWRQAGVRGGQPLYVAAKLLIPPQQGAIRYHDLARTPLKAPLAPGEKITVTLPVRLPLWFKVGYFSWQLEESSGKPVNLSRNSDTGFRVRNENFWDLEGNPENQLSTLTKRARLFHASTHTSDFTPTVTFKFANVIGSALDTLFFSPLWGFEAPLQNPLSPLSSDRPFWPELFRRYGILGFMLGVWFIWRIFFHSAVIARNTTGLSSLGWRLFAVSGLLVAFIGIFSPAPGSLHSHWAFFLLAGFVEGNYARIHPSPGASKPPRRGFRPFFR